MRRPLTDLLLEIHDWTNFLSCFTRITSGRSVIDSDISEWIKLLACLIAEGCNIGMSAMEVNGPGFSEHQLAEVKYSFIREETLAAAPARMVNFQLSQPLAEV